jgi:hypothetical protein
MMHPREEQLILFHYGEDADRDQTQAHMAACAACRGAYEQLQRVLAAVDEAPVPERSDDYAQMVWAKLRPRLVERPAPRRAVVFPLRRWVWAAAMAATVILAFMVGRFWPRPQTLHPEQSMGSVRERILLVAVGDHLERSQMMLVELINAEPSDTFDLAREQSRAQDLLANNRLYRQAALRGGDRPVATFLEELERVLADIANRPTPLPAAEFESLRRGIEKNGILFKVRVIGADVRKREQAAAGDSLRPVI